ncbi:MAG: hypothetical protein Q8Q60_03980 [Candidatus Chromulinivorax sp.]|nr:hypothetical protein [Candidatus Chromulinivorax sp.]
MNIKKFLIVSCIALQFTTIIHASYSQDNFNKAFIQFGGGTDIAVAAKTVQNNKGKLTKNAALSRSVIAAGNTTEAIITSKYLSNQALTSAETTALESALAAAQISTTAASTSATTTSASTAVTTPTATVTTPVQIGDNVAANWTAAINAFGGSAGIAAKTASKTMPTSMASTSVGYADAQVILQYVNGVTMNATDSTNLNVALAANPTVIATQTVADTTTQSATDVAAVALKTEIDESLEIYNSYLNSVSQPQVKIAAA